LWLWSAKPSSIRVLTADGLNPSFGMARTVAALCACVVKLVRRLSLPNPTHAASPRRWKSASGRHCRNASLSPPSLGCSPLVPLPFTTSSKKTSQLPPLHQTLVTPTRDAIEIDELCVSKKRNLWLWTAVSRQSSQFLAVEIGDRSQAIL